jgi:uncharacterized membrane protein YbhN (UPF0104 family)
MANETRSTARRWLITAVKLSIAVVVIWAIHGTIADAWHRLSQHPQQLWAIRPGWLLVAGLLYLVGILPEGLFWHRALRSLGQEVSLGRTLRAYYFGHLGKYVPGKAAVVVMRAGLVCGPGVNTSIAAASVFLETLTMMASGAFLAAVLLVVHTVRSGLSFWAAGGGASAGGPAVFGWLSVHGWWFLASLIMAAVTGLPTLPPVFLRLSRLVGVGRSDPTVAAKLAGFHLGVLLWGWLMMFAGWALLGASLWAALRALGAPDLDLLGQLPTYVAATALALVAGFVSQVPSGAVVREAVLMQSLTLFFPHMGDDIALVGAIVLRLIWLAAEVVTCAILCLGWRIPDAFHRHSGVR